jgi:SAM-dependent methyltransferase
MTTVVELKTHQQDASWAVVEDSQMLSLIANFDLCFALDGARRAGLLAPLVEAGSLAPDAIPPGIDPYLGRHLLRYFEVHGLLENAGGRYALTARGRGLTSDVALAQLGFYVEAYGPVVAQITDLLTGHRRYGADVLRDGRALGEHCATLFTAYHTDTVLEALHGLDARVVLDLGCGGGQFLVDACSRAPKLRGIGLDISEPAVDFARQLAAAHGVADRVQFVVGDAFDPGTWPAPCLDADVLTASGVLHEHFRDGEGAVVSILDTYASLFTRNLRAFILGEPEIRYDLEKNDADLYLVHIFTAQGFPREREAWLEVIARSKLECRRVFTRPEAGPRFNFFELVPRAERPRSTRGPQTAVAETVAD